MEGNGYINRLTIDASGNIWVCEYLSAYTVTEGGGGSGGAIAVPKPMAYAKAVASSSDIVIEGGEAPQYIDKFYIRKLDGTGAELFSLDLSTFAESEDTQETPDYRGAAFIRTDWNSTAPATFTSPTARAMFSFWSPAARSSAS